MFAIALPPLRERKEDLPLLVQAFLAEFNARNQKSIGGVDHAGDAHARAVPLAGQRARAAQRDRARDDPGARASSSSRSTCRRSLPTSRRAPQQPQVALAPGTTVEEAERRLILMTLEHTRDNKTRAAEILGISLKTLHNKLNKLRLRPKSRTTSESRSRRRAGARLRT